MPDTRRNAALRHRINQYAAKFRADTIGVGRYLDPTDDNLAAVLQTAGIVRPARPEEFPAIRAAFEAWPAPGIGDTVRIYAREIVNAVVVGRNRQPDPYVIVRANRHGDWTVRHIGTGCTHDVSRVDVEFG